jgi:hypothetical protein
VRDLGLSLASPGRVTSGVLQAHGVDLVWQEAPIARDLHLDVRAAEGALRIAELRGGPIDLRGAITPDSAAKRVALDLTGTLALDETLLHALGAPEAIRTARGAIAIQELRAELPAPAEGSTRYSARAELSGGSLQYETEGISEALSGIGVKISGDSAALRFEANAVGATIGAVSASADLDPAAGNASGTLRFAAANADFLRNPASRARYGRVLSAYSGAPIAFELKSDAEIPNLRRIRFERALAPHLNAALVLRADPPDDRLRDLDIAADLPGDALVGFLPRIASANGIGSLRVRRSEGGAAFFAEADLTGCGIADGDYLDKKPGELLRVRVEGNAGAQWQARKLTIAGEQGSFDLPIGDDGITASNVQIDLAAFSFLLIDGAHASGRLLLTLDTTTESVRVQLVGVAISLAPELGVDEANGTIAVAGHDWGITALRVRGARSDATFDIAVKQSKLVGALRGNRVDAKFVRAVIEQQQALRPVEHEPDTSPPTAGELLVAVDRVEYGRAEGTQFAATIQFDKDHIHARNIAFQVTEGRVAGSLDVVTHAHTPEPPRIDLALEFKDLSRHFIDDLFEEEHIGKPGSYTGKLRFAAPLHGDMKAMMPDASGSLVAIGRDGTFIGRLGLSTKILTVLRSTEALRMRLPAFRDEGLVFDTLTFDFAIDQGRMEIRKFDLQSISYVLNASGEANFREETARVPIEVNAIHGVTSLVERVPVAGDVLKIVNVRLVATGSPWDLQVRIASITDQLTGAGLAGPRAVIKGVRDVLDLMRSGNGTSEPVPAETVPPETAPDPQPPNPGGAESDR